ncbi:coproporphyrinogen oxidase [Sporobolomyces salmoneus]|uniref:coproporphyrinogen oxidase n=1 Tax=Sporobolomyces salmoneus TaxID=183962 RepID=UPI00317BB443
MSSPSSPRLVLRSSLARPILRSTRRLASTSSTPTPPTTTRRGAIPVLAAALLTSVGLLTYSTTTRSNLQLQQERQPEMKVQDEAMSLREAGGGGGVTDKKPRTRPSFVPEPGIDLDDASIPMRLRMIHHIKSLQSTICTALESLEEPTSSSSSPAKFESSYYLRDNQKGFGDSRVLQNGQTFEKAGCNISVIKSTLSPQAVRQMRAERFDWWDGKSELPYFVAGCSLVVHPRNPHAPTIHFNYRYFEIQDPNDPNGEPKAWWFGGGTDLTPSYLYEEDVKHFHRSFKNVCDQHDQSYYGRFKKWCDEYFYIPHRGETRGVGGIFFDDLSDRNPEEIFKFVRDCSNVYLPAYYPIVEKRKDQKFTEEEKRWQQLRRGRYVEFNLVYDRGTKFGLAMKEPRTESILMSLPLTSRWEYQPEIGTVEGTEEKKLMDILRKPVEWA